MLRRLAVCLAAGVATGLCFEPFSQAWLMPLALAAWTACLHGVRPRRGLLLGWVYGAAFMVVLLPWLRVIGTDAWLGLSAIEALFLALAGWGVALTSRLRGWPVWAACVVTACELARSSVPWGGFPWGRLAFAGVDTVVAPLLPWVGVSGVGFVVVLVGASLAALGRAAYVRRRVPTAPAVGLGVALLLAASGLLLPSAPGVSAAERRPFRVAAVQGDVPGVGMDAFSERRAVLDNHVRATLDLADRIDDGRARRPDFVLWPENSTDIDPFSDPTVYADIQAAVDAVGVPVVVGAMVVSYGPDGQPDGVRNQGVVWQPRSGPSVRYTKRHPVPFGEYIPLRDELAPLFSRLDQIPLDMVPGTRTGAMDVGGVRIGDVICFEVAYDDLVRDVVQRGASVLTVQTNNATYIETGQTEQQFAIARLRALETGRTVVVAATNGISGVIAPDGSVTRRVPERRPEVIEASVTPMTGLTPAVRWGGWVDGVQVAVALLAALGAVVAGRRGRAPRARGPGAGGAAGAGGSGGTPDEPVSYGHGRPERRGRPQPAGRPA